MNAAQEMANKIMSHRSSGGRVWARNGEIGEAFASGEALMIVTGRKSRPVVLPANYVTSGLRREWRNVEFR